MENQTLDDKLRYAKVQLMAKSVFLSTICLRLRHQITDKIPTAATDGLTIMYNPEFIKTMSTDELTGLMAHEIWHIAYSHFTRRNERDPKLWNVAGDYVINLMLTKSGFQLPSGGLLDSQYKDMTTEQVYDKIYQEADKNSFSNFVEDILEGNPQDQSGNPITAEELKDRLTGIIVQAQTQSIMADKAAGEIPDEINRLIDELINPKLDWRQLLDRYVSDRVKTDYSWSRPNKRFMPKHYLPSMYSETIGNITFAIDTSGSMTDEELKEILSEIASIQEVYKPKEITIIDCDSKIHNVYSIDEHTDILDLKFSGGGGTSFYPVINYCDEHVPNVLVYFTDLYATPIKNSVEYDILWICNSEHEAATIGETIYLNG